MKRAARFEVVLSDGDQPWFGREMAGNGKERWRTSETYASREGVERAILGHARMFWCAAVLHKAAGLTALHVDKHRTDRGIVVRFVDERTAS